MGRRSTKKPNFDHLRTFPKDTTFDFEGQPPLSAELQMRRAAKASLLAAFSPKRASPKRASPKRASPRSPKRSSPKRALPPQRLTKPQLAFFVMKNLGSDRATRAKIDVRTLHPPHRTGTLDVECRDGTLRFFSNGTELLRQDVREDTLPKINALPRTLMRSLHLAPLW